MTRSSTFIGLALPLLLAAKASWAVAPVPWGIGFQNGVTPIMDRIETLAGAINLVIACVVLFVCGLLGWVIWRFNETANPTPSTRTHNTRLEVAWTLLPALILLAIAVPSFSLLYFMELARPADMTIKVTGHQWYWSYEYPDQGAMKFDALMVADESLKPGQPRLLTADNPVVLPVGLTIRIQITSDDVIHSWSIPAFGVKTDAMPGRLNEAWVEIDKPGLYYGQCSQLCGVNHGFMPITIRAVPPEEFKAWAAEARNRFARQSTPPDLASSNR